MHCAQEANKRVLAWALSSNFVCYKTCTLSTAHLTSSTCTVHWWGTAHSLSTQLTVHRSTMHTSNTHTHTTCILPCKLHYKSSLCMTYIVHLTYTAHRILHTLHTINVAHAMSGTKHELYNAKYAHKAHCTQQLAHTFCNSCMMCPTHIMMLMHIWGGIISCSAAQMPYSKGGPDLYQYSYRYYTVRYMRHIMQRFRGSLSVFQNSCTWIGYVRLNMSYFNANHV
jgi:hypothetical protein